MRLLPALPLLAALLFPSALTPSALAATTTQYAVLRGVQVQGRVATLTLDYVDVFSDTDADARRVVALGDYPSAQAYFEQEFSHSSELCATRRHEGAEKEKRRSARHFPCCVLEGVFSRDLRLSA
ncbi:hypothetical protein ACFQDE_15755 [Deinococcus caeni]|uniref:Uncharacterized protein n=1 Tax=Deinococcus caeni TaxID=569127 RepID=A0ABP9UFX6_9DEIO